MTCPFLVQNLLRLVQGALLVKNFAPTSLDASTDNLFSSLVPDSRFAAFCFSLACIVDNVLMQTLLFVGLLRRKCAHADTAFCWLVA